MKIVVLDKPRENPGEIDWSALNALGEVEMNQRVPQDEALDHIKDADVIMLNKTNITEDMIKEFPNKIINIHHSFLPAFVGAKPYHAAYERGVKIIGATSHYVTTELDAGPIIEQDVVRVTHKDTVKSFIHKGQDLEKIVLSRAVEKHIDRKVLAFKNRTVVFS